MNIQHILEVLQTEFSPPPVTVRQVPVAETFVGVQPDQVHAAVRLLLERFNVYHLSTITGLDNGQEIELFYHFWDRQGLTLHTRLPRGNPVILTIIDLIPGAAFYEREVTEMLDVMFEWHPMTRRLILADDRAGRNAPLRKEV